VFHLHAKTTGSHTIGGSADLVRYILGLIDAGSLFPTIVISFGICYGVNDILQKLTDVIISEKVYAYGVGIKIKETSFFVNDDNKYCINDYLKTEIRQNLFENGVISEDVDRAFFGNYITGEAVISNSEVRDMLVKAATNQNISAGEMEGYGVFRECNDYLHCIPCILIKSICDWAAVKNIEEHPKVKDKIQALASLRAYEIFGKMLEYNVFPASIYDKTIEIITNLKKSKNAVVFVSRIKDEINKLQFFKDYCGKPSDKFVLEIINQLIIDGIVSLDENEKLTPVSLSTSLIIT
jgi:nucleoside phosphorylase